MARLFMRLQSRIWDDEDDFVDLSVEAQRLYAFLGSQPNLNHAGMLPVTLRRWATKAKNLTAAELERQLYELEDARFIILDLDREELLIRTHIRNDGVYKQPRVMGAAVSDAMEITSKKLRAALVDELDNLPLDELSDSPTERGGVSIRRQIEDHVIAIRLALRGSRPPQPPGQLPREESAQGLAEPPSEGVGEGVGKPLPEDPSQPLSEGVPEGVGEGVYARGCVSARADAPTRPAPAPAPAPGGPPAGSQAAATQRAPQDGPQRAVGLPAGRSAPPMSDTPLSASEKGSGALATVTHIHPDAHGDTPTTTDQLVADWLCHIPKRPPTTVIARVGRHVKEMLADGIDPADVRRGIAAWAVKGKDPSVLPSVVNEVMNAGWHTATAISAPSEATRHPANRPVAEVLAQQTGY